MKKCFLLAFCFFLSAGIFVWPVSQAMALVDVELSFEPDTVAAGDWIVVSASISNLCDCVEIVDLSLSVSFWGRTIGPVGGKVRLEPFETRSAWQEKKIPRCFPPGYIVFTIAATAHDGVDTEVTTLTILPSVPPCPRWRAETESFAWMDDAASTIITLFEESVTPVESLSWGSIKALFKF